MYFLNYNTASQVIPVGPAVDISDGYTNLATLDISTADHAYMMMADGTVHDISGNTWAAKTDTSTPITGWYDLTVGTTETDVLGRGVISIYDVSLCLPIFVHFCILPQKVYNSLIAGSDNLETDVVQWLGTAAASVDTAGYPVVTIKDGTGAGELATTSGVLDTVGTIGATGLAAINAEVVDTLSTDAQSELAAVPAANAALSAKINWLFLLARNKITQTASTQTVRNDADGADVATASVSDDGTTTTRAEWS